MESTNCPVFLVLLLSYFIASTDLTVLSKQCGLHDGVSCSSPPPPCEQLHICENEVKATDVAVPQPSAEFEDDDIVAQMRSEECNEKDTECFRRRMIAEAHLDYIYTENQKP